MEDMRFKKDETPHIVFRCKKCRHYLHAKTTQNTKKCTRCGHSQTVKSVMNSGEIVLGLTAATQTVIQRQNELAVKELGAPPDLKTENEFQVASESFTPLRDKKQTPRMPFSTGEDIDYEAMLKEELESLSKSYPKFPWYIVEIFAEEQGIPSQELNIIRFRLQKEGYLIPLKNKYFKVKSTISH